MAIFRYCVRLQSHGWARTVYVDMIDPIQGQSQGDEAFELTAHFHIYLLRHFRVEVKIDVCQ